MVSSVKFTYSVTLKIKGLASIVGVSLETLYPNQTNKLLSEIAKTATKFFELCGQIQVDAQIDLKNLK